MVWVIHREHFLLNWSKFFKMIWERLFSQMELWKINSTCSQPTQMQNTIEVQISLGPITHVSRAERAREETAVRPRARAAVRPRVKEFALEINDFALKS